MKIKNEIVKHVIENMDELQLSDLEIHIYRHVMTSMLMRNLEGWESLHKNILHLERTQRELREKATK